MKGCPITSRKDIICKAVFQNNFQGITKLHMLFLCNELTSAFLHLIILIFSPVKKVCDVGMHIIICDDDRQSAENLRTILLNDTGVREVMITEDINELSLWLEERKKVFDILMMDIVLDDKNGIDVAAGIARKYPELKIVFITGYTEKYAQDIFLKDANLRPYALVSKPYDEQVVTRLMNMVSRNITESCRVVFNSGHKKYSLLPDQIVYIESNAHISTVHTANADTINCYKKLSDFKAILPESFDFCHKSFLVNFDYINGIRETDVLITDNHTLPLSRRYAANFRKKLLSYRCFGGQKNG